jgi:tripartite-type tricarboxylate transporter receptor subunit TctC
VTDIVARLVAQKLSERLGQQFYIENIGGAGGNLGMANAARSPGDGYTILFASSSIVVNPSLYSKIPFDVDKESGRRCRVARDVERIELHQWLLMTVNGGSP